MLLSFPTPFNTAEPKKKWRKNNGSLLIE